VNEIVITVIGNVCSEVRFLKTEAGVPVASFRVASTPRRYRAGGSGWTDGVTTYASVTCWRAMAEHVASSISVGQPVIIHGRLTQRSWEKDGRTGQTLELEAYGVGHDLKWGTSAFQKTTRKESEPVDSDAVAADLATSFERDEVPAVPDVAA
jgi:single-strand DNA-binding protein